MEIKDWVRAARAHAGLTQDDLAEKLNMTKGNVSSWENGRHSPSFEQMLRINELTGHPLPISEDRVRATDGIDLDVATLRIKGRLPLISWVQAGGWSETIDNFAPGDAAEWLPCTDKHSKRAFALTVSGESMFSPGDNGSYSDGEIIFVDPEREPVHKSCVVVRLQNENTATFKRLLIDGDKKYLEAVNPSWPNRIIQINGDADYCGVVFGSYRRR